MRAEKEINLIPAENRADYKRLLFITSIAAGVLVLMAVSLFAYILPRMQMSSLKSENAEMLGKIAAVGDIDDMLEKYEAKIADLQNKKNTLITIDKEQVKVLDFLKNLSSYLPENVYLSSFSMSGGQTVDVSFSVANPIDIAKLTIKLREMDAFEDVSISSFPLDNVKHTISFNLKIKNNK